MNDKNIIEMFFTRNISAISALSSKYKRYCAAIAKGILGRDEDVEEVLNDTYFKAWNTIPPQNPKNLKAYVGKITRNICIDRYKKSCAQKRGGGETEAILDELSEIISGRDSVENELERRELLRAINDFLDTLPKEVCNIFVSRYWYCTSVDEISKGYGKTCANVSTTLHRTRIKLREYLTERGIEI